jgi:hypothetical protein
MPGADWDEAIESSERRRMQTATTIIRELADISPYSEEWVECIFCDVYDDQPHEPYCTWRRANEFIGRKVAGS